MRVLENIDIHSSKVSHVGIERILYVHGYGGSYEDAGLIGFLQGIADGGFIVKCALLPLSFTDLKRDIVGPLGELVLMNDVTHIIGFSLGALAISYLNVPGRRVFISPLWGLGPLMEVVGMEGALAIASDSARAVLGGSAGKRTIVLERSKDPTITESGLMGTAEAVDEALMSMPPPAPTDVAIISRSDHIISLDAIAARGVSTHTLMGGHMIFSGHDRNKLIEKVLFHLKGSDGR